MDTLTFVQPLSLTSFASSPSRGALGIAVQFVLLTAAAWHTTETKHGAAVTERLYRDEAPPPLTAANEDGTCTIL